MVIRAGADERERFVPQADTGPGGDVDSYVLMQKLAGQNHLLEQLHAAPRYIQDGEWVELERVLRLRTGNPSGHFARLRHQGPPAA